MSHDPGQPRPDADCLSVPAFGLQELEPRLLLSATLYDAQELLPTGSSQDEVVALGSGDLTFGIDVSKWQGTINWNTVANSSNVEFVFTKATEGVDYVDPQFLTNMAGAHNAGLLIGGYHFATPFTGGANDAASEASDFYAAISPYLTDGYLRPVLDFESGLGTYSKTQLSNWVHDFMNAFSSLSGGIVPIIYTGSNYANNALNSTVNIYDLWLANWPTTPNFNSPPTNDGVWNGYDLWQYSGGGESIPGIAGGVDGDVFFGDIAELIAKYGINTTPDDHGDDLANATTIGMPSSTAGVIGTASDSDWFKVTLGAGTSYTFSLLADGLVSGELRLYSDTGTLITSGLGPAVGGTLATIQYTTTVGGVFYLSVDSSGVGGYELGVQKTDEHSDSIVGATQITGGAAFGGLQTPTDKDYFRFTASLGKQYGFDVFGVGLPDAVLELYNSSGVIVSQQIGSGGSPLVHMNWQASSSSEMYLVVRSNAGSLGDYALSVTEQAVLVTGDLNGDGFVGINDLNIVLGNWNQNVTAGSWLLGDPSGDGYVGIEDLNAVLGNWNAGTPPVAEAAAASQDESLALAGGTQILGIDVSHWQAGISWASVAASGKEFAFIRALDRDSLLDTRFLYNIVQAKANGIWAGAYQFVTPWTYGYNDAVEEARLFASTIAPYLTEGYIRPVIDIEAGPPHSPTPIELDNTVLTNWVHEYMAEFVRLTGIEPLIYTNTNHAQVAFNTSINVYDLWLANWTNNPNNPPAGNADGVWNGYDFWQYSSTTSVPGIAGNVDGDVFFGSLNDLIAGYGIVIAPDDHGNVLADATAVSLPSATAGTLDTIMDDDWFSVALGTGQSYTFNLVGGSLGEAEFALYTETGTLIASTTGPGPDGMLGQLQYTPLIGGTYHLRVSSTNLEVGSYGLSVQETDDHGDSIAEATTLVGGLALGGIQNLGDKDYFHFTATEGKQYDIKALDFGIPDAVITLYDALGTQIDQQSGSNPGGTHAQLTWTASASAEMYFSITAAPASTGDYIVTLAETDAPNQLDGDLDDDGFVGIGDMNIVLANWNQNVTAGDWAAGDPSGDGFVGIEDLNVVLGNWNAGTPPVAAVAEASGATQAAVTASAVSQDTEDADGDAIGIMQHGYALAIANARSESRSAFDQNDQSGYAPAFGLWEPEEVA
ncbi:MAG: GH25 family lysozyme [Phycisphaerales bacterium]